MEIISQAPSESPEISGFSRNWAVHGGSADYKYRVWPEIARQSPEYSSRFHNSLYRFEISQFTQIHCCLSVHAMSQGALTPDETDIALASVDIFANSSQLLRNALSSVGTRGFAKLFACA